MIHFVKQKDVFKPLSGIDIERWNKIKENVPYCMRAKRDRNYEHHKKLFAIAKNIIDNEPDGSPWENKQPYILIKSTEFELGYVTPIMRMNGKIDMEPESIDFEHWDQEKFEKFYDESLNYWSKHFGYDRKELENNSEEV